jgi:translation initiation factor 2 gamma subunit (eIF-2gamma)
MGLLSKAHTHVALLDHPSHKPIILALITHLGLADCAVLFIHLIQHMNRPQPKLGTIAIAVCLEDAGSAPRDPLTGASAKYLSG